MTNTIAGSSLERGTVEYETSLSTGSLELLTELGRATTAYHEALPDRIEAARPEYEDALERFKATA